MNDRTLGGVSAFRKRNGVLPGQCTWCREPVPKGCQTWCRKAECLHEYQVRNDPSYARAATFARDHGVCAACLVDTEQVKRGLEEIRIAAKAACEGRTMDVVRPGQWGDWSERFPVPPTEDDRAERGRLLEQYSRALEAAGLRPGLAGIGYARVCHPVGHLWEMDHIVEVVRGGGGCGLDNLQTLCLRCHKAKTAKLAADRARERRAPDPQAPLFTRAP